MDWPAKIKTLPEHEFPPVLHARIMNQIIFLRVKIPALIIVCFLTITLGVSGIKTVLELSEIEDFTWGLKNIFYALSPVSFVLFSANLILVGAAHYLFFFKKNLLAKILSPIFYRLNLKRI